MRVTPEMPIAAALALNEQMVEALVWLTPDFEQMRDAAIRSAVAERTTVAQAARMAHVSLNAALYALNLMAGEDEARLARELMKRDREDFEFKDLDPIARPRELLGLSDCDPVVHFVDAAPAGRTYMDPEPAALDETARFRRADEVLLVHTPFDPVPLRDRLAGHGFASWAEPRGPRDWYVYFYRPHARAGAVAFRPPDPPEPAKAKARAMAARA